MDDLHNPIISKHTISNSQRRGDQDAPTQGTGFTDFLRIETKQSFDSGRCQRDPITIWRI